MSSKKRSCCVVFLLVIALFLAPTSCFMVGEKVGVLFIHHGGMDTNKPEYMWNAAVSMFTYDPHHAVYQFVIWNPAVWSSMLNTQVRHLREVL